ncbi:hypothetical protein BU23DRAFT_553410 [Bimuria novae-zelandiae CBS 107.79]|uniref:Mediator of RNA polymerase II transcription subunit 8 n=1 Tax=Bimuria novae-zelandiae CBS 107.79 TaxID=1447943 RepID=A0A6A5VBZ6_9PLEO|nr:hypothetical protein BU23DRAFT_553410 [Bimuria novae-zelandiae CBS 107.79]
MASNVVQVATGEPDKADIAMLESLRARLMSLVWILEQMKKEILANQQTPPDWPTIQRNISAVSGTINSIQSFINNDPKTLATFRALHAFPIPPMPNGDPQMAALIDTIFSKEPGAKEQDWIRAKLVKAAEFAHVPGDWGIEAKRANEDDDEEMDGVEEGSTRLRRQKAYLDEDQLAELWRDVYDIAEDQAAVAQNALEESGDEDEDEDEEMEDVEGTGAQTGGAASAHKSDAKDVPMMSLNTIHKFMSTGAAL